MAKRANGEGTWGKKTIRGKEYVRFRKKYDNIGFKDFYGKTQKEVRAKVKEFETQNKTMFKVEKSPEIFEVFMLKWLDNVKTKSVIKPLSPKTVEGMYELYNTKVKGSCIGDKQLLQLNSELLEKYVKDLIDLKIAKSTISKTIQLVKQCLSYAYKENLTEKNLSEYLIIPSEEAVLKKKKEIIFLSPNDTELLYKEAKRISVKGFSFGVPHGEYVYKHSGFVIIFLMYTGLRLGELLELRWKDVDMENKYINISRNVIVLKNGQEFVKPPKTKSGIRKVPLCDRALECLEYFRDRSPEHSEDDLVMTTSKGTRFRESNLNRVLKIMLIRGGCQNQNCSLHGLRHTFGSFLLYNGADIAVVSALLGHAQVSTTYNIYIHVIEEQKFQAISIFDNIKRED